jgi:enoyl-CoA hydratase/carnithine racemase
VLNAFNFPMVVAFVDAIEMAEADDAVRVIIITGTGDRAFSSGADISKGSSSFDYAKHGTLRDRLKVNGIVRDGGGWIAMRLFNCVKPLIAAVNGSAAGMGATLQTSMDFRFAANHVKYAFPFVRRGIVPESASSWFLPHIVGLPTALDWCLTGRRLSAEEVLEKGLVRSLHERDELIPAARAFAREIIDHTSPVAVALTRRLLWRMAGAGHPMDAHRVDSRAVSTLGPTPDVAEGVLSFLEKRKPNFPGKVSTDLPDAFPRWEEPEFF